MSECLSVCLFAFIYASISHLMIERQVEAVPVAVMQGAVYLQLEETAFTIL